MEKGKFCPCLSCYQFWLPGILSKKIKIGCCATAHALAMPQSRLPKTYASSVSIRNFESTAHTIDNKVKSLRKHSKPFNRKGFFKRKRRVLVNRKDLREEEKQESEARRLAWLHSSGEIAKNSGSTDSDKIFQSLYDFYTIAPYNFNGKVPPMADLLKGKDGSIAVDDNMPTLKNICISKIVENSSTLTSAALNTLPWKDNWEKVWHDILLYNYDSFRIFKLFYEKFGHQNDFQCHSYDYKTFLNLKKPKTPAVRNSYRDRYISKSRISAKHRMEAFANNINYQNLIVSLNSLNKIQIDQSLVFLDLKYYNSDHTFKKKNFEFTTSGLSNETQNQMNGVDFFKYLPNITNLKALDVSGTSADNQILKLWSISISSGKWSNLQMLVINDTNITDISDMFQLVSHGNLRYIEFDGTVEDNQLSNHFWNAHNENFTADQQDNLAQKFEALKKRGYLNPPSSTGQLLFDVQIVNEEFDIARVEDTECLTNLKRNQLLEKENQKLTSIWKSRNMVSLEKIGSGGTIFYVRKEDTTDRTRSIGNSVTQIARIQQIPAKNRKKICVKSARSFFDI